MMKLIVTVLTVLFGLVVAEKLRYTGYKLYKVQLESSAQIRQLAKWFEQGQDEFVFDQEPVRGVRSVKVVVKPERLEEFEITSRALRFNFEILSENFQEILDTERIAGENNAAIDWTSYWPLEAQYAWLDELITQYPGIVTNFTIGNSYEGRPIRGVTISYKKGNPAVFIESNIHAREWITSATCTWIINALLTSQDPIIRDIAENVDWHIIPVLNVDGFVYTHTTQRLWRKTRSPNQGSTCIGTDPNRNFGYLWSTGGSSTNPCSDTYAGPTFFSDPETRQLAEYYNRTGSQFDIYLAFHSYSQLLMYPYAARTSPVVNEAEHRYVGLPMQEAIKQRYGTEYDFGDILRTIYESSGASVDWIKGVHDTPLVYLYEFRDLGRNGFVLPAEQIIPNAEEVLDSIVVLVQKSREIGYLTKTDKVQPKIEEPKRLLPKEEEPKRLLPKEEEPERLLPKEEEKQRLLPKIEASFKIRPKKYLNF